MSEAVRMPVAKTFTQEVAERTPSAEGDTPRRPRRRRLPTLNDICERALRKWEAAGRPAGSCLRFWLEAEEELLQGN
jgi:hypothetical protein